MTHVYLTTDAYVDQPPTGVVLMDGDVGVIQVCACRRTGDEAICPVCELPDIAALLRRNPPGSL